MEANYFTMLYWFCHTLTWIHHGYICVPHPDPSFHLPPHPIPLGHPSAQAPSTLYHASNLDLQFVSHISHVSMPFSQIIPPLPSPTESKRLFTTSVSLLLSRIQGYCYHLSKFHMYALVYCIGVFLSGLLHSVYSAPVSSISSELIQMNSFSRRSNTPLCICTTAFLSIHLLMDI